MADAKVTLIKGKVPLLITETVKPYSAGDVTAMAPKDAHAWVKANYAEQITEKTHPEHFKRFFRREGARIVAREEVKERQAQTEKAHAELAEKATKRLADQPNEIDELEKLAKAETEGTEGEDGQGEGGSGDPVSRRRGGRGGSSGGQA